MVQTKYLLAIMSAISRFDSSALLVYNSTSAGESGSLVVEQSSRQRV